MKSIASLSDAVLAYCRPGFENECAEELLEAAGGGRVEKHSGWVVLSALSAKAWRLLPQSRLIFSRQALAVLDRIDLNERDRLSPILASVSRLDAPRFQAIWLERPDTNEGKALSGFCRHFGEHVTAAARTRGWLDETANRRLHLFFPSRGEVWICSRPVRAGDWPNGIPRLRMPSAAPSRSTMKLLEAIHTLVDEPERRFREGMRAVDLGAAPGGWTYQLVLRGLHVWAVDNGPMKGALDGHPQVRHLREDGFRFQPRRPVDWLVCDMVEQPIRIAELIARWFVSGHCRQAIFNLKLPMKKRYLESGKCFALIDQKLRRAGIAYQLNARQLYHDREEITCYLAIAPRKH
ncbi:23S rRNA (cytidine(2498)-2'-O)-methyltransferase RlmM [Chromobacterium sp. IIBBL 290-4]|uniref:23S rRNA (cytidine(2498)-2'-O)-methyltransferase RlmM n=1 Tax=Chromobacterium sp. IIBBL 290-4 TaxID=2953890 RepID=UPI0020B693B0|nr:23S rRNA (cytidine(2498)-2'-O)-methyltransferase RlmM [Chromobacterium sp. IIBBL 290-4]UTH74889.1 23S rRNA (cytidine(2498)-2'-O)-methyltransferase RlmM [Chromobacterium sp. IIBBL 290-4]